MKFEISEKYLKIFNIKLISCRASEKLYKNITKNSQREWSFYNIFIELYFR